MQKEMKLLPPPRKIAKNQQNKEFEMLLLTAIKRVLNLEERADWALNYLNIKNDLDKTRGQKNPNNNGQ